MKWSTQGGAFQCTCGRNDTFWRRLSDREKSYILLFFIWILHGLRLQTWVLNNWNDDSLQDCELSVPKKQMRRVVFPASVYHLKRSWRSRLNEPGLSWKSVLSFKGSELKDASNYDANKNLPSWRKAIKAGSFREMRIPHLKFTLPRPAQPNKVLLMVSPCMEQQVALLFKLAHRGVK